MTKNRDITLENISPTEETSDIREEEAERLAELFQDMRVGIGGCWLQQERTCDESCMAFNHTRLEEGESPCLALIALRDIADTGLEQRSDSNVLMQQLIQTNQDISRHLGVLTQLLQNLQTQGSTTQW